MADLLQVAAPGSRAKPQLSLRMRPHYPVRTLSFDGISGRRRTLQVEILRHVHGQSTIMTDEFGAYRGIGMFYGGRHATVNHGSNEYARQADGLSIHVNTAESFNALIKRGHYGVYHKMSVKHLGRYCDEFSFRWSRRKQNDSVRTEAAIKSAEGKRLLYETPSPPQP